MNTKIPKKNKNDDLESLKRKYEEEDLDRKAKAGVQADICTAPLKMFKFHIKKKPLIQQVTCKNCGKIFKTNSSIEICYDCKKNI